MQIKKQNFLNHQKFLSETRDLCIFIKSLNGITFRVCHPINCTTPGKSTELSQVLTTLCTKHKNGIWFFPAKEDVMQIVVEAIILMDICPILVALEADPATSN